LWILPLIALATIGVALGVPGVGKSLRGLVAFSRTTTDIINFAVKPANLPVTVTERGILESSQNKDVFNKVEGQTTIIMILPEGTAVTKGQVVCELDSSALQDNLKNQRIATLGAEAAYQQSKLTREVAEIAVTEYVEGVYKQEKETAQGEIALAKSELKRAEDRLEWSNRMLDKGYVSKAQNVADKVGLEQKKFALEQAQTKLDVLEKYTKEKTIKELKSEVEKTKSDELAKKQTYQLEQDKEAKLVRQIEGCKLTAPGDGLVVYANDPNRFGGSSQPQIEEGATVRERQKIFSLPDISHMQVNTKVHESMVDRIDPGLRARIRVESFPDDVLTGSVKEVAPLPDPNTMFSSDVKVYTTKVTIDKGLDGLRPGMSAQVEILVTELENVLSVPVQAILEFSNKNHVAVRGPEGTYDWREVTLGLSNDKLVEVKKGIKSGEVVALNPISLMSEEEKREAFSAANKDATKKDWGKAAPGAPGTAAAGAPGAPGATPVAKVGADGKAAVAADPEAAAKAKAKAKAKGKGGGFFSKLDAAAKAKFKTASPEEKRKMLEDAGMPAELIDGMMERMNNGGGFGGPRGGGGGGFGGGGGGGGFGGPPGGGSGQ
jgi:multidrug resistance efflux pump